MARYPSRAAQPMIAILWLGLVSAVAFALQNVFSAEPSKPENDAQTEIECLTPHGQASTISPLHNVDPGSAVSIIDKTSVSCPLREGETTFVITLPKNTNRDRLTFVNENAAACGELKI